MAFPQLYMQFKSLSLFAKLGIGMALLVLLLIVAGGTRSCVSSYKDAQADKKQAQLKAEGDAHRQRADEWEAQAKALETDKKIAELALERISKENAAKQALLKQEDARAAEDAAAAGQDVDAVERCRRLCDRAKRLKLIAANADCGCG